MSQGRSQKAASSHRTSAFGLRPSAWRRPPDALGPGPRALHRGPCAVALALFFSTVTLAQNWPSFRGTNASGVADGHPAPVKWNATTGEGILWKTPIPGVAVSSPIVWGDRVFVSTAVSSDLKAGIRTGQYGDVEPVNDATSHSWRLFAID